MSETIGNNPDHTSQHMRRVADMAWDWQALCGQYWPGDGEGALWNFYKDLRTLGGALHCVAAGFALIAARAQDACQGGLKPQAVDALAHVFTQLMGAANAANELPPFFRKLYADELKESQVVGRHTARVPVGAQID